MTVARTKKRWFKVLVVLPSDQEPGPELTQWLEQLLKLSLSRLPLALIFRLTLDSL